MITFWDGYSFLRKHIGIILIGGAAISIALAPASLSIYVILIWGVLAAWLVLGAQLRTRRIARRFNGELLEFVFAPTPMGSLIDSLSKQKVTPESIKTIDLMSADVAESLRYYAEGDGYGGATFLEMLKRSPEIKVTVYGNSLTPIPPHPGIEIIETADRYVIHTNLVITKDDRKFVWFEPYHNVVRGRHYFSRGAYLFAVNDDITLKVRNMLADLPRRLAA